MSARLNSLILCDFAQVREGLLFVQSGGLTRLLAPAFPAKFPCRLACLVELPAEEAGQAHAMAIKVKAVETATLLATINVALHEARRPQGLAPGEPRLVPVVVPLDSVVFPSPGEYDVHVELDDHFAAGLSFRVGERPR